MRKFLVLFFILFLVSTGNAETLSLSTFYPSPYGAYTSIRIMPTDTTVNPITCDASNVGLIYYDSVAGEMIVCGDTASEALLVWRQEDSGVIHPIDTNENLFVGIGDPAPDALLEISASGLTHPFLMLSSNDNSDGDILSVTNDGSIGIGSATPHARLTLDQDRAASSDGGILAFGSFGNGAFLTASGAGTRMFWYPRKAAFRAGTVTGDHWDDAKIGDYSVALGFDVTAEGVSSTSIGSNNTATSLHAVSIGDFNGAIANYSVSIGYSLVNNGIASVAMGKDNQVNAPSTAAITLGSNNQVIGDSAIALGESSTSLFTVASTAIGYNCGAYGVSSIAFGYNAQATESYSTSMGYNTVADEILGVALGRSTTVNGFNSLAIGNNTLTDGQYSSAFNVETTATAMQSNVFGRFNIISGTVDSWVDSEPLLVVGNGSGDLSRSNALTVLKTGDTVIGGEDPQGYRLRIYGGDATVDAANSWLQASDARLKKQVQPLTNVLGKVMNIQAVGYNVITEPDEASQHIGFIAQEIEKEFPEVVNTSPDGYKSVSYATITPILVEALKELKARNDRLRDRFQELQKEFEAL